MHLGIALRVWRRTKGSRGGGEDKIKMKELMQPLLQIFNGKHLCMMSNFPACALFFATYSLLQAR